VPIDLSPKDPTVKKVELVTDAKVLKPGEKPAEVEKPETVSISQFKKLEGLTFRLKDDLEDL